jgi:hypothetical protein
LALTPRRDLSRNRSRLAHTMCAFLFFTDYSHENVFG